MKIACGAGDSVKPGVERSETPGIAKGKIRAHEVGGRNYPLSVARFAGSSLFIGN
jgi:hypothetical protein